VLGHVLEFVPEGELGADGQGPALLADALEPGQRYRVVVTGAHGLYRYDINDVVECVGRHRRTARIAFVHKGGNMLSITGEKVGERHVVEAMAGAEAELGQRASGFSVACVLGQPPRYVLAVEPRESLDDDALRRLLAAFERRLEEVNVEYAAKRASGRLGPARLAVLRRGAFDAERGRRVAAGAPDAQVKPPHLTRDPALLDRLGVEREVET
jgi:hypothetical protein